ncbi:MAG: ATP-binding protein, partial [Actinomycetota bacterium]|nr:ATP-binding protein [Actinomycetota bacterium]
MYLSEEIQKKWSPVLDHPDLQEISDPYRKSVTAVILENQEKALQEEKQVFSEAVHANNMSAAIDTYDPILISLVRRALPNLMAYDVCGVQPMSGPTGL